MEKEHVSEDTYGSQQHQSGLNVKETSQGVVNQTSVKDVNTIITSDQVPEVSTTVGQFSETDFENASSTEPTHVFPSITNRWIKIKTQVVEPGNKGDIIFQLNLPESLFSVDACSPNILPFIQFVYGKMDMELKFVITSNKYKCGKFIASVIPDPAGLWDDFHNAYFNTEAGLQRQFIFLDCDGSRTATLNLNWIFHRSFIRLLNNDYKGIQAMQYMKVIVQQLSPVKVADGQDAKVTVSCFAKISRSKYAGMTFRTLTQGPVPTQKIRNIVNTVTYAFDDVCSELNLDKPSMFYHNQYVIPAPRLFMSPSRTLSDAVPLRVDPSKLTLYNPSHRSIIQYHSLLQIARIWGLVDVFQWKVGDAECHELAAYSIDPSDLTDLNNQGSDRHLTPLEYVTNMFMFRTGCIEFRFDFVTTFFHSGVVMISIEFGKKSDDSNCCESGATYTKVFNLGDQKTCSIVVPYIYDTVWRRNANLPVTGCYDFKVVSVRSGLMTLNTARLKVRVVNPLVANNVAQSVDVLCFARAGANFSLKCPVQMNAILPSFLPEGDVLSNWPPKVTETSTTRTITLNKVPLYSNTFGGHSNLNVSKPVSTLSLSDYKKTVVSTHTTHAKLQSDVEPSVIQSTSAYRSGTLYDSEHPNGIPVDIPDDSFCTPHFCLVDKKWVTLPKTQGNDQGEQDQTETFLEGPIPSTQMNENHTDISDLIKKPLMLMENSLVKGGVPAGTGKRSVFLIPCMPPQPNMFPTKYSDAYNSACLRSIHTSISSMFRFWRGSQRFILIFHSPKDTPNPLIKVAFIPHSGVRYIGNSSEFYGDSTNDSFYEKFSISDTGIPFEIVVPSVNPTINVEVPFYTEVNWAMLHQGPAPQGGNADMPWRDKMDENTGHIVIESSIDVVMDVIWQAGDDFQFAGFIGCPKASRKFIKFSMTDDYSNKKKDQVVSYQADDFIDTVKEKCSLGVSWMKENAHIFVKPAVITAVGCVAPAFTMPLATIAMAPSIYRAQELIKDASMVTTAAVRVMNNINDPIAKTALNIEQSTTNVNETVSSVCDSIRHLFSNSSDIDIESMLVTTVFDVTALLKKFSWMSFSTFIVKLLVQTKMLRLNNIMEAAEALHGLIVGQLGPVQQQAGDEGDADSGFKFFISLITVGIMRMLGITPPGVMPSYRNFFRELVNARNWSIANQISKVMADVVAFFKSIFRWCLGYVDPSVNALRILSEKKEFISLFIHDAQKLLLDQNNHYLRTPAGKMKFWITLCNAMQIQQSLAVCPEEKASPILSALARKIIDKGNDMNSLLSCAPVRYEPIVVVLEGAPGIGKSRLVNELAVSMLESIGFKSHTSDVVYVRNPGTAYWNGYTNHPVIVYDDFLNLTDPESVRQQVQELYELKSCAVFNPNMAALPEKDIRANPLIVFLCMNDAYPYVDLVRNSKAFFRRRDIIIRCNKVQKYAEKKTSEIDIEVLEQFKHFEFLAYKSSEDKRCGAEGFFNYDVLTKYLCDSFNSYHEREKSSILTRLKTLQRLLPENSQKLNIIGDPFTLFYKTILDAGLFPECDDNLLPSEQVQIYCDAITNSIEIPTIDEQITALKPLPKMPSIKEYIQLSNEKPVRAEPQYDLMGDLELRFERMSEGWHNLCKAIRHKSRQYANYWINILDATEMLLVAECLVCHENKTISHKCSNSTATCQHVICYTCVSLMQIHGGNLSCPLCRNEEFNLNQDHRYNWFTRVIGRIPVYALRAIIDTVAMAMDAGQFLLGSSVPAFIFYQLCCVYFCGSPDVLTLKIFAFSGLVTLLLPEVQFSYNHMAVAIEEYPIEMQCDDCDTRNIPAHSILHSDKPQAVCLHHKVHPTMQYRLRSPGNEVFLCESENPDGTIEFDAVSVYPCENNDACPWKDSTKFRNDIKLWLTTHHTTHVGYSHNPRYRKNQYMPPYIEWEPFHTREILEGPFLQAELAVQEIPTDWWTLISDKIGETIGFFYRNLNYIIGVFGFVGTSLTLYTAYSYLTQEPEQHMDEEASHTVNVDVEQQEEDDDAIATASMDDLAAALSQSDYYGDSHNRNRQRQHQGKFRNKVKFSKQNRANLGYQGPQEVEAAMVSYSRNLGAIIVCRGETEILHCGFVGFKYNFAIIPTHYIPRLVKAKEDGCTLKIRVSSKPNLSFDYDFNPKTFQPFFSSDLSWFNVPAYFPMFNNITRFIMTEQEYSDYSISFDGYMIEQPSLRGCSAVQIRPLAFKGFVPSLEMSDNITGDNILVENLVSYNYSKNGACGSLVLSESSKKPILGIHVAGVGNGTSGTGYAIVLTREMFEDFDEKIPINGVAVNPDVIVTETVLTSVEELPMEEVGKLPSHLQVHIPTTTNIVPSLISVDLPRPQSEPAILSHKDQRFDKTWDSPILAGIKKYGKVVGYMKQEILDEIESELSDFFCGFKPTICKTSGLKPLSISEALVGIPGVPYYDAIPRNTSAGWPWNRGTVGKYKYVKIFDVNGIRTGTLEDVVMKKYEEEMHLRKQGYLVPTLFSDVLKDERRLPTKTRSEGGTRIVCGSPVQYTVAVRQHWQHFAACLMHHRIKNMTAVGINPDGPEWGFLFENLTTISHKFVAFDYKNFGPAFSSQALDIAIKIAMSWLRANTAYNEEELLVSECLLRESQHSFHTMRNIVVRQFSGAPSGNPITTILNCLVNIIYVVYSWKVVTSRSFAEFRKYVSLVTYGDDLVMTICDSIIHEFNGVTSSQALLDCGIKVTDAKKTGIIPEFILINEVTFLKRSFCPHPTRLKQFLAPLETISVEECAKWIHKSNGLHEATQENADTSVRLAYTNGKEYYVAWKEKINTACRKNGFEPITYTWEYIDNMCFDKNLPLLDFGYISPDSNKIQLSEYLS